MLVLLTAVIGTLAAAPSSAGGRPSVVLDPGHGGSYPGAVNCDFHFAGQTCMRESDLNLDIALRAAKLLRARGYRVVLTRNTDENVDPGQNLATHNQKRDGSYVFTKDGVVDLKDELQARVNIANCGTLVSCAPGSPKQADAFLSIHNNSCTCNAHGTSTFEYRNSPLAQDVQQAVLHRTGLANRGVQHAAFYVVRWTRMPSALLEGAFMSNNHEARLLHKARFRRKIAQGIAAGVALFLGPPTAPPSSSP